MAVRCQHPGLELKAFHTIDMNHKLSDSALLNAALATVERVLARADSDLQGAPYFGPTSPGFLEDLSPAMPAGEASLRGIAEQSAINICLSSAAALIDVSRTLMDRSPARSADAGQREREWQALVAYTKTASRSAYRAALILAAQQSVRAALDAGTTPELGAIAF